MPENDKKILFFLTRSPYPSTDGTRKKIAEDIINSLFGCFSLDFLLVGNEKGVDESALKEKFVLYKIFYSNKIISVFRGIKSVLTGRPLQVEYYFKKSVLCWLKENIKKYDAIYIHTIRLGKYIEHLSKEERKKIFFDFNDAISLNYMEAKRLALFPWNLIYWYEERRVRNYETRILSMVSHAHVVSDFDEIYLLENYKLLNERVEKKFYKIKAGMDVVPTAVYKSDREHVRLLFFGNAEYPPNRDAIFYFSDNIFPKLKEKINNSLFCIAGNGVKNIELSGSGIKKYGYVDDLNDLFQKTLVVVAPIRFGAGVPTKILEALSRGVPVITTPLGVRGLAQKKCWNDAGIICVSPEDVGGWIVAVKMVMDTQKRSELSTNAHNYIKENYDREIVRSQYRDAFSRIIKDNF